MAEGTEGADCFVPRCGTGGASGYGVLTGGGWVWVGYGAMRFCLAHSARFSFWCTVGGKTPYGAWWYG